MKTKTKCGNQSYLHSKKLPFLQVGLLLLGLTAGSGSAQTYTVLHSFTGGSNGYYPPGSLLLSDGALFGAAYGGSFDRGLIFRMSTDGTDYTIIKEFTGSDGSGPNGGLVLSGGAFYGTTGGGGTSNYGTVFQMNRDGTGYTVLKSFTGSDGRGPNGDLVLSGGTLYGTTDSGGSANKGTMFKLNTDGSGFTVMKHFTGSEGANPQAGLVLSGTTLYGTVSSTVLKLNTDGSDFAVLIKVSSIGSFYSPLVLSGTTLYGTAMRGGMEGRVFTVFKLNTDGSGFAVVSTINGYQNAPTGEPGLVLAGTMLYGTITGGDPHFQNATNSGTVFRVNSDGSGYTVLQRFDETTGVNPSGALTLCGTTLYGVATYGPHGNPATGLGYGVVFSLSFPPPTIVPASQTVEIGATARFRVDDSGFPAPPYQWCLDGTNLNTCGGRLELTNAQPGHSGTYTIVATNGSWSLTSSPAFLNVIPPVQRRPVPGIKPFGEVGSTLNLEYTDAVALAPAWLPLATMTLASPPEFCFDLSAPLPPQRFYRAWQTGQPSVPPSLKLPGMVPALTLIGDVSSQVRVDGINAIGPIDAWFTLDTVTLTNTSQLYFDVSCLGQPRRLYRLIPVP